MKSAAFYFKVFIIVILLLTESFILMGQIYQLAFEKRLFAFSIESAISIGILLLLIMYTIALSVGIWNKWEHYLVITLPIFIAINAYLFIQNVQYGIIMALIFVLLLGSEIYRSSKLRDLLLKDKPNIFLKFTINRLLILFSILGGLICIFDPKIEKDFDIGQQVAEFSGAYLSQFLKSHVRLQTESLEIPDNYKFLGNIEIPEGALDTFYKENLPSEETLEENIAKQVNEVTQPYKKFIQPTLALAVFGLIQFYGIIAHLIFALTADGLFWIAKKIKFLNVESINVTKDVLRF